MPSTLAGAELAHRLADQFSTAQHPRFVAGSIGPSGILPSLDQSAAGFDDLKEAFREQAAALITGGVDLLLLETQQDILEVKSAIHGIHLAFDDCSRRVPIQVQVTLDCGRAHAAGNGYQCGAGDP